MTCPAHLNLLSLQNFTKKNDPRGEKLVLSRERRTKTASVKEPIDKRGPEKKNLILIAGAR